MDKTLIEVESILSSMQDNLPYNDLLEYSSNRKVAVTKYPIPLHIYKVLVAPNKVERDSNEWYIFVDEVVFRSCKMISRPLDAIM
jgi:hypothetical protein